MSELTSWRCLRHPSGHAWIMETGGNIDDTRLRATVTAIANDLTDNGIVLRYRTDETDDGLSGGGHVPDLLDEY